MGDSKGQRGCSSAWISLACGDGADDQVLIGRAKVRVHGQAHDLTGNLLGHRGAVGAAEMGVGRLFVERHRVMHGGGDAGLVQTGLEGVAILDPEGVLGEDAGAVFLGPGEELKMISHGRG